MTRKRIPAFFIGLRYILAKQDNRFISTTSIISMAGLTLGVMALIIVLSVFNGAQGIQRDRTLITVPHADLYAEPSFPSWQEATAGLEQQAGIEAIAPYTLSEALVSKQGYHEVTQVRGIVPEAEMLASTLEQSMLEGSLHDLQPGAHNILIGRRLAANLRLFVGDAVNITVPRSNEAGTKVSLDMQRFTVAGIFDVHYSIGSDLALIHIDDSMTLLGIDDLSQAVHLRLKVTDIDEAATVVDSSLAYLNTNFAGPEYLGEDWSITEASLFNALKLEKFMTWLMLMMIVAIGAFNIVSTLVMIVAEKQADIAILRTMGAGQRTIMGIFLVQGCVVGIFGILLGAILGTLIAGNFSIIAGFLESTISPGSLYVISSLPAELHIQDVVLTCSVAFVISFLATLYPAWKASFIMPAQVLRYE
ncbi:MAG: lipoprotein-releasing ABC transporter permease subunit [Pseudomonadota bacterium]